MRANFLALAFCVGASLLSVLVIASVAALSLLWAAAR